MKSSISVFDVDKNVFFFNGFPELRRITVAYIEIIILSLYEQSKIGIDEWIRQCDCLQLHQISSDSLPNLVQPVADRII